MGSYVSSQAHVEHDEEFCMDWDEIDAANRKNRGVLGKIYDYFFEKKGDGAHLKMGGVSLPDLIQMAQPGDIILI